MNVEKDNIPSTEINVVDLDTRQFINEYIEDFCQNPEYFCNNSEICKNSGSVNYTQDDIHRICTSYSDGKKCKDDIQSCTVSVKNLILGEVNDTITSSFNNILIPIPSSSDPYGNPKFIRLPPLSASKSKDLQDICNSCACIDSFAIEPGPTRGGYTAPGQDMCIFPTGFEYIYYPIDLQNVNKKLGKTSIQIGKYNVVDDNIIEIPSTVSLEPGLLYDILVEKGIPLETAYNFIISTLHKNALEKTKNLILHIKNKNQGKILKNKTNTFYKNMTMYYIIFIVFVILIIINLTM